MASNPLVVHDHAALEDAIDEQLEFIIGPDIDYINIWTGDSGLECLSRALQKPNNVISLDLSNSAFSESGISHLCSALKNNTTVKTLILDDDGLEPSCGEHLGNLLKHNTTLKTLSLNMNFLSDDGVSALCEGLKYNSTLSNLKLKQTELSDDGTKCLCEALRCNSTLRSLNLSHNDIYPEGIKYIAEMMRYNSGLSKLCLAGSIVTAESVKCLCDALTNNYTLKRLDLSYIKMKEIIKHLSEFIEHNTSLTELNFSSCKLNKEALVCFGEALKRNVSLIDLDLSENALNPEDTKYLSETLKDHPTLSQLSLKSNFLGDEGTKYICELLEHNSAITSLNLEENNIGDEGMKYLGAMLHHNSVLRSLHTCGNKFGPEGIKYIAEALRHNRALIQLELTYVPITDKQLAATLVNALQDNFIQTNTYITTGLPEEKLRQKYNIRNQFLALLKLEDRLVEFLNDESLADVSLRTQDGDIVWAHKIVLAARSSYFRAVLQNRTNENSSSVTNDSIVLDDTPTWCLRKLLYYMYSDILDNTAIPTDKKQIFLDCVKKLVPEHFGRILRLMVTNIQTHSTFSADMSWAVNNPLHHDVVFIVGDEHVERFYAHKVILCARSLYFKAMLTGGLKESNEKEIRLEEVSPDAFLLLLKYIYTKNMHVVEPTISSDLMVELFELASQYGLEPLKRKMEDLLIRCINLDNVLSLIALAGAHHAERLVYACLVLFAPNIEIIRGSMSTEELVQHTINSFMVIRECFDIMAAHTNLDDINFYKLRLMGLDAYK